jgi:hypothetical protein
MASWRSNGVTHTIRVYTQQQPPNSHDYTYANNQMRDVWDTKARHMYNTTQ